MEQDEIPERLAVVEKTVSIIEERQSKHEESCRQRDVTFNAILTKLNGDVSSIKGMILIVGTLAPFILWLLNKLPIYGH